MVVGSERSADHPSALAAYQQMLHNVSNKEPDPSDRELDELPADADEKNRQDLAERMLPQIGDLFANHPEIQNMEPSVDKNRATETMRARTQLVEYLPPDFAGTVFMVCRRNLSAANLESVGSRGEQRKQSCVGVVHEPAFQ